MPTPTSISDQELLSRLAAGDQQAFRSLFDHYYPYLVTSAYAYVSDTAKARDLAQDVFVDLWDKRATYAADRNLKAYLRRAVVNRALNYLKREQRLLFSEQDELPVAVASEASAHETLEAADLSEAVRQTVDRLPERCRIIFRLSRHDHLPRPQIAAQLGISVKTVENQLTKALNAIRVAVRQHAATWISLLLVWGGGLLSIVFLLHACYLA